MTSLFFVGLIYVEQSNFGIMFKNRLPISLVKNESLSSFYDESTSTFMFSAVFISRHALPSKLLGFQRARDVMTRIYRGY